MSDDHTPDPSTPSPAESPSADAAEVLPDDVLDAVAGGRAEAPASAPAAPKPRGGAAAVWSDASGHFD